MRLKYQVTEISEIFHFITDTQDHLKFMSGFKGVIASDPSGSEN